MEALHIAGLKQHHAEAFKEMMFTKTLNKKEYLIQEGTVCNFIGIVASGSLRSFLQNNKDEFNNDFYFENHFISAYTSFLTQQPTKSTIQALTDVQIHYITYD